MCFAGSRTLMYFNSQPHKEADRNGCNTDTEHGSISTHSLTRRLTMRIISTPARSQYFNSQPHKEADFQVSYIPFLEHISTHSLTRRLTKTWSAVGKSGKHFNSQPHKEADILFLFRLSVDNYFNSQPHKEADSNFIQ